MKIAVIGGGPAGLYFALLAKKKLPHALGNDVAVEVFEQNPRDATFGFGIVLADRGLDRLKAADAESCQAILDACYPACDQMIIHQAEPILVKNEAYRGGAIARLHLLQILAQQCEAQNIPLAFEHRVESLERFQSYDLVVGADGANSMARELHRDAFGVTTYHLNNRLAWYGTSHLFQQPTLCFKKTEYGYFWMVCYPYAEDMSTFVAECDAQAWANSGLANMSVNGQLQFTERLFAEELAGNTLIDNNSLWRQLPVTRGKNWYVDNCVLIGDALTSTHPSIGSGTRIAMEDSIALLDALQNNAHNIQGALREYVARRRATKQKLVDAAERSIAWYESITEKLDSLSPISLVFDYLTRTGRVDEHRLTREFPEFMSQYAAAWQAFQNEKSMAALCGDYGVR